MKRTTLSIITLLFLAMAAPGYSQNKENTDAVLDVQVTHAQFLGKTPPLRSLVPLAGTSLERREVANDKKRTVPNFVGRKWHDELDADALPKGADPVLQASFDHNASTPVEPIVNIDGMDEAISGANPPDVCGDIGNNVYVQMVNASFFKVYDKEGNAISGNIATNTIWSQVGQESAGDPIILYDEEADRWIITEFPFGNILLFAISDTDDPLGTWNVYAFSTPNFPDYPKYSVWPNAYCVTTNEQGPQTLVNYFINREEMLAGVANPTIQRITVTGVSGGPGFFVSTPVDWSGANPPPVDAKPMILRLDDDGWGSISTDGITIFEMDIDWDNPGNTSVEEILVPTAPFNTAACAAPGFGFACIPQLNGNGIDGIPELIMHQAHYRNFGSFEAMVLNFLVNADGSPIRAGIRWMELRRSGGNDWEVYQEGTFAPADGKHRFMGGIAMDGNGNIGLAYSISSPTIHPGLGFTGRKASDPLGQMTVDEYIVTDGFSVQQGDRYGDYAQMVVDPADDKTFWYTGEYRKSNNWGTKIFSFQLGRDTNDIGPSSLLMPLNADNLTNAEQVQIRVKNFGLNAQSVFSVGYVFENNTPVIEPVNFMLQPDGEYVHTFATTVDMSLVGDYHFTLFTSLPDGDDAILNDTLRLIRSRLPRWDAGVTDIEGLDGLSCAIELPASIVLTNFGTQLLTTVTITVNLNGAFFQTINWTGSLVAGASTTVGINLTGFVNGANEVSATTSNPNGEVDEVMANDGFTRPFDALTNGVEISLLLLTDNYPEETTWELEDENGNVIYTGGAYGSDATLYTETWCLDPSECYTFTIFDAAGDGLCCGFGLGNYSIVDENGGPIVTSTGEFGDIEIQDFCAIFECMMTADIDVSAESVAGANDGALMITPQNGLGPFMYSIDGGNNFQTSSVFDNLPAGDYNVVVTGDGDCLYEETVSIPLCGLAFTVTSNPESNSNSADGQIVINAVNGNGTLAYSINGGNSFQSNNTFNGLNTGTYEVIVADELGCSASTTVFVDIETATKNFISSQILEVFPNPTTGVFRVKISGLERQNPLLPIRVFDASGKIVQTSTIGRFNGIYTGQVSLLVYPSGVYFVRFMDEKMNLMAKVIKE